MDLPKKPYYLLLPCLLLLGVAMSSPLRFQAATDTEYPVRVLHPGISLTDSAELVLVARQAAAEGSRSYYADVESVVCGDKVCRIDLVRIWWDELGNYQRLDPPKPLDLEKKNGQAFTARDYRKLDTLLADRDSPLKDVYEWEIVGPTGGEGVDAMSSATIALDTDAYVAGAVWTCYTLWHWVNGGAVDHIRRISGTATPTAKLLDSLRTGSTDYRLFALQELTRRADFSTTSAAVAREAMLAHPHLAKAGLTYFSASPDTVFAGAVLAFLANSDADLRLNALRATDRRRAKFPLDFLIRETEWVTKWARYQEVHVLLRILRKAQVSDPAVLTSLATLLRQDDLLTARIAYWYLREQNLSAPLQVQVDSFYQAHRQLLD